MKTKRVPKIDEELSAVGFGCWTISGSNFWNNVNDQDSIKAVQKAVELEVNFFDVAPVYGFGHSESILGEALKGNRHIVFIASKCGLVWDDQKRVSNNLTKHSLFKEIDDSLQRLQTDYIDLYQIHWPDPNTPIEETMEALELIKESGKIRYIGITNFSIELMQKAMNYSTIASHQGLYNMLERNADSYHNISLDYKVEKEVLPFCQKHGMAFFPYSPLFQALLAGKFKAEKNFSKNDVRSNNPKLTGETFKVYFEIAEKLKAYMQEIDKPLVQVAINWLINQEAVTSVICGARNAQQVEKNIGSVKWDLTDEIMEQIEKILTPYKQYI